MKGKLSMRGIEPTTHDQVKQKFLRPIELPYLIYFIEQLKIKKIDI